jgi:nicotinamidase-related amidase
MGVVSNILDFRERSVMPTLVLVDLHDGHPPDTNPGPERDDYRRALDRCRAVLTYARSSGFPIAFVRHNSPAPSFLATQACPSWVHDIRPTRSEMVFERAMPSCYASSEFAQMAQRSRKLVLAGLFGESSCLATVVEGFGRNHHFIYLADASVSREIDSLSADDMHRGVAAIASRYCEVMSTEAWIGRTRKLGAAGSARPGAM